MIGRRLSTAAAARGAVLPGCGGALRVARPDLVLREQCLVGGRWVDAPGGGSAEVLVKATGEPLGRVPWGGGAALAAAAVDAASEALPAWRATPAAARAAALHDVAARLRANREDLAAVITAENGKPLAEALGEVEYSAQYFDWFAGEAPRAYGDVVPSPTRGSRMVVLREPVGVVAAVTPWNFPLAMLARKAAAALAAGCTMVAKPSELTPFAALALGAIAGEDGGGPLPPGVFNCVTGEAVETGAELTSNAAVRKVSFTGSTAVGKLLMRQCADGVKRVSMELGGMAPLLVFDDARVDLAVRGIVASKFRNAGQTCVSAQRVLVQAGVHDEVAGRLAEAAAALAVDLPWRDGAQIGPLINGASAQKVRAQIDDAVAGGARVVTGGAPSAALGGTFFEPTVLAGVRPGMACMREETFGPLAPLVRFETEEEAVALANDTPAGLAAYLYTESAPRQWRVAEALEAGMVGVNESMVSSPCAPFGGVKESGIGREGSKYGLDDYTELKYINFGGLDAAA